MSGLSSVSVTFIARHFDPILDEAWHEHEWTVTAWRSAGPPWTDGRSPRVALGTLMANLAPVGPDGVREFPRDMWSNEAIAVAVLSLANVVKASVSREGFGAEYPA